MMPGPTLHPHRWAILFVAAAVSALGVDLPLARIAAAQDVAGDLSRMLAISEVFAHGCGVIMILVTAAALDPANRPRLVRVSVCAFGAGGAVQIIKHLVSRVRPYAYDLSGDVFGTFWLHGASSADSSSTAMIGPVVQSFPSGHSATAVGLAFGLAWLYPRGRWLFVLFAAMAAAQRVQFSAHFLSDTLAGAAIGSLIAGVCLGERGIGAQFSRLERAWSRAGSGHDDALDSRSSAASSPAYRYVA